VDGGQPAVLLGTERDEPYAVRRARSLSILQVRWRGGGSRYAIDAGLVAQRDNTDDGAFHSSVG
jgi:hypothetical protein